ncbi:MAG: helix-turn-helix domain-containing protein [Dysgonomonas sp.]
MNDLKKVVQNLLAGNVNASDLAQKKDSDTVYPPIMVKEKDDALTPAIIKIREDIAKSLPSDSSSNEEVSDYEEEALSLEEVEKEMIKKALDRHNGKRKNAAEDLKISERTLYRKIKEYNLE